MFASRHRYRLRPLSRVLRLKLLMLLLLLLLALMLHDGCLRRNLARRELAQR
jgi:hypothetical protein